MRFIRWLFGSPEAVCACGHPPRLHDQRGCLHQDVMSGRFCPCRLAYGVKS